MSKTEKSIDRIEVIKGIKETIERYNLEGDQRFNYSFREENGDIFFSVRPTISPQYEKRSPFFSEDLLSMGVSNSRPSLF